MQEIFHFWSFLRRYDVATFNVTITELTVLNSTYLLLLAQAKPLSGTYFYCVCESLELHTMANLAKKTLWVKSEPLLRRGFSSQSDRNSLYGKTAI